MARVRILHRVVDGVELKHCSTCKEWKPLGEFYRWRKSWDGLNGCCKDCTERSKAATDERRRAGVLPNTPRYRMYMMKGWLRDEPKGRAAKNGRDGDT